MMRVNQTGAGFTRIICSILTNIDQLISEIKNEYLDCLGAQQLFEVELSLREAIVNAMVHGNQNDPDKMVTINISLSDSILKMTISDEGPGFDVASAGRISRETNQTGGRGIWLMRKFGFDLQASRNPSTLMLTRKL
jgi:serine/threonine-protein kinase RsbW